MTNGLRRTLGGIFPRAGYYVRSPRRWAKRLVTDKRLIRTYLQGHAVAKLQVGAGMNLREGWLNGDIDPVSPAVIYLDASHPFPFPDKSFHYVYSEHMIEHVPYTAGRHMLGECYRILAPGGRVRICTPDLGTLLGLYRADRSKLEDDYLAWCTREFCPDADRVDPVFVINNAVRDWGHQFIYDEPALTRALQKAGFTDVVRRRMGESDDPHLRGLENIDRMPPGLLELESVSVEAVKR